jgi:hypothetical protein
MKPTATKTNITMRTTRRSFLARSKILNRRFIEVVAAFALDFGTPFSSLGFLQVVILSEAKNLSHFFLYAAELNNQRCFASLNMTRTAYFA